MKAWERVLLASLILACLALATVCYLQQGFLKKLREDVIAIRGGIEARSFDEKRAKAAMETNLQRLQLQLETTQLRLQAENVPWVSSDDKKIEARLAYLNGAALLQVRNATDETLVIHQPGIGPWDCQLTCDGNVISYRGAVPQPAPPIAVDLLPGAVMELEMPGILDQFHQKGVVPKRGTYCLRCIYRSGDSRPTEV